MLNMKRVKSIDVASFMMLVWLAFYVFAAFFATDWAAFLGIIGCTVPMLLLKKKHRGETFGAKDCNAQKYMGKEYVTFFLVCISGSALISALCYIISAIGYAETEVAVRNDFLYVLVFGCFIPAFFEEWFIRGGVLGALAPYKAAGVWISSIFFMLMHANPVKYPYAFFAGICIGTLVYLTECIYLGMLLHFLNNFASLLLSQLPRGNAEYIALACIAVVFVISLGCLRSSKLFEDAKKVLCYRKEQNVNSDLSPLFCLVVAISLFIMSCRFI